MTHGYVQPLLVVALCVFPVLADVPAESCLHADGSIPPFADAGESSPPSPENLKLSVERLRGVMGIAPQVSLIGSPTGGIGAASPPCRDQAHPIYVITVDSGTLAQHEQQLKGLSVVVLAHELGHVLQFLNDRNFITALCSNTLQGGVRPFELMADFAAGYALYKTQRLAIDQGNTLFVRVIASLSDYAFTNVQHHGTVTERMNAFGFGEAAALRGRAINMAALMRNSAIFLERLAGPSQPAMAAGGSYEAWVQQSLDEIGQ